jgi:predicted phosphodiesterase
VRRFRCAVALAVAVLVSGCLSPAEQRTHADQAVGERTGEVVSVRVAGGHAAVRELNADTLVLWQSAPSIEVELDWYEAGSLRLELLNSMPNSELSVTEGEGLALAVESSSLPTRAHYSLSANSPGIRRLAVRAPRGTSPFKIGLMSDVQEAIDEVGDIFHKMNAEADLDFILGAGDLTRRGTSAQLRRFQRELEALNVPYYTTLGNHEVGTSPPAYHALFGRGSYSFEHRDVRFTLLDSASATIDPTVYEWLEGWGAEAAERLHVVAMHIPPIDPVGVRNGSFASRAEANKLLGRLVRLDVDLTLYGHIHSYYRFENAGIEARISGGGGAIPERFDSIGRHFLVIDFDPQARQFQSRVVRVD